METTQMNKNSNSASLLEDVLAVVSNTLNLQPGAVSAECNLIEAGLDSITLMNLVSTWRAAGYDINFADLAKKPFVGAWVEYLRVSAASLADNTQDTIFGVPKIKIGKLPHAPFSLAPMQYAYWLGRDVNQPLGGVSAHLYCEFELSAINDKSQPLDLARLTLAIEKLVQRHSSLRLQVCSSGQQIHNPSNNTVHVIFNDLRDKPTDVAQQLLEQYRSTYSSQMLDIESGEVFAVALSLLENGNSRLHLDIDMIAADAVSYRTLLRDLALLYDDPDVELADLAMSYKDCRMAIEHNWESIKESSGMWWQTQLASLPNGPLLPLKAASSQHPITTRRHFNIDPQRKAQLYAQCRQYGLTPSVVLATVLAETLAGWSKDPRFILNVPLFQRPLAGPNIKEVVGDFSSSILLDVDTGPTATFVTRARDVQSSMHEGAARADYGGVHVLRDLGRARGQQVTAPVVFTSALNLGELFDANVRRVFGDPIWIISQGPQVLLDAQVTELDGGILINWDCREDAFVDGVLDAMFNFFSNTVVNLVTEPGYWDTHIGDTLPKNRAVAEVQEPVITKNVEHDETLLSMPIVRVVASIWHEVIGGDGSNIHQNLFAAGGDSVLASSLIAQIREIFGSNSIDMKSLFSSPSIAGIAASITDSSDAEEVLQIAQVYCEILDLDDDALSAELEMEGSL